MDTAKSDSANLDSALELLVQAGKGKEGARQQQQGVVVC